MKIDHDDAALLDALLGAMEVRILPLTREGVAQGNKIFGAALLSKRDLAVVLAETNNEIENPLWHGEIHTLKRFYEMPAAARPDSGDLIFLSTHEPCSMCLSAIAWAGFDNFFYFFSHEDSRDAFNIPHDLNILKEVFTLEPGRYRRQNTYWHGRSIRQMIAAANPPARDGFEARAEAIAAQYGALSDGYQERKAEQSIPLS